MDTNNWTSIQQNVYVNGLGKIVGLYPSGISEIEDLNHTESYSMKMPGPQTGGPMYPQQQSGFSFANPQAQLHFALAAAATAPKCVTQPQNTIANQLRSDSSNNVHSHTTHSHISAGDQQLFIPRIMGPQSLQPHSSISPSVFPEMPRANNGPPLVAPVISKSLPTNGSHPSHNTHTNHAPTAYPANIPIVQHPGLSHMCSPTGMQHHPPYFSPAMPQNLIEFIPSMYSAAELNSQGTYIQPSPAMFSQLHASQLSCEPITDDAEDQFTGRSRRNTWNGLEPHFVPPTVSPTENIGMPTTAIPKSRMNTAKTVTSHASQNHTTPDPSACFIAQQSATFEPNRLPRTIGHCGSGSIPSKCDIPDVNKNNLNQSSLYFPVDSLSNTNYLQYSVPQGSANSYESGYTAGSLRNSGSIPQVLMPKIDGSPSYKNLNDRFGSKNSSSTNFRANAARKRGQMANPVYQPRTRSLFEKSMHIPPAFPLNMNSIPCIRAPWRSPMNFIPGSFFMPPDPYGPQNVYSSSSRSLLPFVNPNAFNSPFIPTMPGLPGHTGLVHPYAPAKSPWNLLSEPTELRGLLDLCPTRILISSALVGAVIGRGGRTIRSVTASTGAVIEFKPVTLNFCQFSLLNGVRNHGVRTPAAVATKPQDEDKPGSNTASTPSSEQEQAKNYEQQYDRSQVLFISGSREQCSAAISEILSICFRESSHKGLGDPCLALLVQSQVYDLVLLNHGRAYFNALRAATGVRITVADPTPCSSSGVVSTENEQEEHNCAQSTPSGDRILIINGPLCTICTAEVYIGDEIRIATAQFMLSHTVWRLLPLLQLESLSVVSRSKLNADWSDGLQHLNKTMLQIAEAFWPHTVCSRLAKHPSFNSNYHESLRAIFQLDLYDAGKNWKNKPSPVASLSDEGTFESTQQVQENADVNSTQEQTFGPTGEQPVDSTIEAETLVDQPLTAPRAKTSEANHLDADFSPTTIQQAILAMLGSVSWLATSGSIYMRITSNEAGILIGSGGCRIQQLIQLTGAQIHVNKAPVDEPYALIQVRRHTHAMSNTQTTSDAERDPETVVASEVPPNGDLVDSANTDGNNPTDPSAESESIVSGGDQAAPTDDNADLSVTPPCSLSDARESTDSRGAVYRLVTLSGPYPSQLLALWRIFQRLKFVHTRANLNDTTREQSPSTCNTPFCLATIICLPYRFASWLKSQNSKFSVFMPNRATDLNVSSPLQWLQCELASRGTDVSRMAVNLLPEPKHLNRWVRQQRRRRFDSKRDGGGENLTSSGGLDGLDSLWSDPNCVPLEIYADYEMTQVTLGHLHRLLTIWLYGQTLIDQHYTNPVARPANAFYHHPQQQHHFFQEPQQFAPRPHGAPSSIKFPPVPDWVARFGQLQLNNSGSFGYSQRPPYSPRWRQPVFRNAFVNSLPHHVDHTARGLQPNPSSVPPWAGLFPQDPSLNPLAHPASEFYGLRYSSPLVWNYGTQLNKSVPTSYRPAKTQARRRASASQSSQAHEESTKTPPDEYKVENEPTSPE